METLNQEKEEQAHNQLAQKKTKSISLPNEIIQDILSRLPVKPILQFRSVSKHWLSLISHDPSFPKLHFNRSLATNDRTSFFISAYDTSTDERHFLSAPLDGGPVTHLITLNNARNYSSIYNYDSSEAEHLNGLVFFTSRSFNLENFAFVVNPATRKVFEVPPPSRHNKHSNYFFGFDESTTQHKILSINSSSCSPKTIEFMIFSLSTYSWRHIPVDLEELPPVIEMTLIDHSVCVNSVTYLMLNNSRKYKILAFDLTAEKFSIINLPQGAIPREFITPSTIQGEPTLKWNKPFLIKDNDLLGVVCHELVVETNEMQIWILQDDVNRVWVRETVSFSESWIEGLEIIEIDTHDMKKLVFSGRRLSRDMVSAFTLNMKTKSFKLVKFNLGYQFLHSKTVKFHQVRSYVESILPVREE